MTGRAKKKKPAARKAVKTRSKAKKKPVALAHDTPVDTPALVLRHDTLETPAAPGPAAVAAQALARAERIETIGAGYEAWAELRLQHASALARLAEERKQLEQRGEFLVGAVRAARDLTATPTLETALALAKTGEGLDAFVKQTAQRLEAAKQSVEQHARAVAEAFGGALSQIKEELRGRIRRTLKHARPHLKLMIRTLASERRILHVARIPPEEAVLLAWVLLERLPSRYDFLFDDSTDDATQAPPTLFAEEGVLPAHTRPGTGQLAALLEQQSEVLPIKGGVPFFVPRNPGPPQLTRLIERGPVMEAEVGDGDAFRNFLFREEAERLAGYFLQLKLQNKIELELSDG